MLVPLSIFLGSLALLILAARFFTGAAERIGLALGMSSFVVGVFIVAIGTSLPELVASLLAVKAGASEIVSGNVLGANASNLLLLLGIVSIVSPGRIALGEHYLFIDLNFMLGSMLLLGASMVDGNISAAEGLLLIGAYASYTIYLVHEGRSSSAESAQAAALPGASRRLAVDVIILMAAGFAIYVGGEWTVDALREMATVWAVPPAIAAVTILSIGTTLPELAVSVTAARRGQGALAVGNILGSTIFNSLAVAGAAAVAGGVVVPTSLLMFALPFVAASTLLFYLLTQDKLVSKWEGLLFLNLFALFMLEVVGLS